MLCVLLAFLVCRFLSSNQLTGSIPKSLCRSEDLYVPAPRHLAVLGAVLRCVCVLPCFAAATVLCLLHCVRREEEWVEEKDEEKEEEYDEDVEDEDEEEEEGEVRQDLFGDDEEGVEEEEVVATEGAC